MPLTVRDVLRRLRQDGWYQVSTHWRVPAPGARRRGRPRKAALATPAGASG